MNREEDVVVAAQRTEQLLGNRQIVALERLV